MSFSGGFVGTVVGSLTNNITPALDGIISNPGSFAVSDTISYAVKDVANLSLQAGQNYALTQISSALPTSLQSDIAGQISNAAINAGINLATNAFANALTSQITDAPGIGGGSGITGTVGPSGQQPGLAGVTDSLPPADYGGNSYTLTEVVFTIVPYKTGASDAGGPQTSPIIPLSEAFNGNALPSFPGANALKTATNAFAQSGGGGDLSGAFSSVVPPAASSGIGAKAFAAPAASITKAAW